MEGLAKNDAERALRQNDTIKERGEDCGTGFVNTTLTDLEKKRLDDRSWRKKHRSKKKGARGLHSKSREPSVLSEGGGGRGKRGDRELYAHYGGNQRVSGGEEREIQTSSMATASNTLHQGAEGRIDY